MLLVFSGTMIDWLLSWLLRADLLILLSDVVGLYNTPPSDPHSKLIHTYLKEKHDEAITFGDKCRVGQVGMNTKVKVARYVTLAGIPVVITSGYVADKEQSACEMAFVARDGSCRLQGMSSSEWRRILLDVANALKANEDIIRRENESDVVVAQEARIAESLVSRLTLKPGKISEFVQEASRISMSNSQGRFGLDNVPVHKKFWETNHYVYEDLIGILGIGRMESGNNSDISMLAGDRGNLSKFGSNCNPAHTESVQGMQFPPSDGKLRYVGGETHIITMNKDIAYGELMQKTMDVYGQALILKYRLPDEDLDALVFVSSDEALENMIEEYDRLENSEGSSRLQVFLFTAVDQDLDHFDAMADRRHFEQCYVDVVNGIFEAITIKWL
eukprot:Gb_10607 [translate_table: standard]